jgi:type I restriction enzyme S subunit
MNEVMNVPESKTALCKAEPELRFSAFGSEWKLYKFKDIVKLDRGSSPRPIVRFMTNKEDGVNWIKIGDTKNSDLYINSTREKITKEGAKKSRKVSKGEIILSNSMSYGKPYILNIDGYIHDGWFVIRGYEKHFNKSYLLQILGSDSIQKQYQRLAAGGVVNNISSELVYSVKTLLPSLEEQQKIADFLSSVDKKIEQLTEKHRLLTEYKKGVMQQIFTQQIRFKDNQGNDYPEWECKKIKDLFTYKNGGAFEGDVVKNGSYNLITLNSIDIKGELKASHKTIGYTDNSLSKNDLIMVLSDVAHGNFLGLTAIIPENDKYVLNQRMGALKPKNSVNPFFIRSYINFHQKYFKLHGQGSSQQNLSKGDIEKFIVNSPCEEEQQKIADFLTEIDQKIDQAWSTLEQTKAFKKGLLQQMFV